MLWCGTAVWLISHTCGSCDQATRRGAVKLRRTITKRHRMVGTSNGHYQRTLTVVERIMAQREIMQRGRRLSRAEVGILKGLQADAGIHYCGVRLRVFFGSVKESNDRRAYSGPFYLCPACDWEQLDEFNTEGTEDAWDPEKE